MWKEYKMPNLFGKSMVSIAVMAVFAGVNAAEAPRANRSGMMGSTVVSGARMPTMPTTGLTTIGNPAVTVTDAPTDVGPVQQTVTPTPTPKPDPEPEPKPVKECEDGGVKNSDYTISMCMNDLKRCINNGALQGGMTDLYNEEVRNSVFTGMRLCQDTVDKCIADVRVNCHNIYNDKNDVWLDFNSRVIQPDYYNFVLHKTGLTPFQAENTCLLLDRNTYGSAFTSVSDIDAVRAEYQKRVGAYNGAYGNSLSKNNPLGVEVNSEGYDGQRGHYARWDAANAECLLRVGAYNKNSPIKNSWLFGGVGNDNIAEVWKPAGSQFTCDKDLFGFSLLNDTKTAAVVGIAGGAVVGAGVGAGIGAAVYDSKKKDAESDPCTNAEYRKKLGAEIMQKHQEENLNMYIDAKVTVNSDGQTFRKVRDENIPADYYGENMSEEACKKIHKLVSTAELYKVRIDRCLATKENKDIAAEIAKINGQVIDYTYYSDGYQLDIAGQKVNCPKEFVNDCLFVPLQTGYSVGTVMCQQGKSCMGVNTVQFELGQLNTLLESLTSLDAKKSKAPSKGSTIGKGAAIGAAAGVGVGGLATAITAFVERSNITCKVGDGLNSVGLGKSHKIDTLRDFYVKWNLKLPDAIAPTSVVTDAESWNQACEQFNNKLYDCPNVQINYKKNGKTELIPSACKISGNLCIVNDAVAVSRGEDEKEIQKIIIIVRPEPLPKPIDKPKPEPKPTDTGYDYDDWQYSGGGTWTGVSNK